MDGKGQYRAERKEKKKKMIQLKQLIERLASNPHEAVQRKVEGMRKYFNQLQAETGFNV